MTTNSQAHSNDISQQNDSYNDIIKSANDKRDYAYVQLENGFKLLVISDKNAQRAAAAVDVGVGSSGDFDEFPGLAHFLEHMLFLGTDKYPDPDGYINYISKHGGNHNAFTAFDHTNYFFDIDPKYLHEGLKRFSRFFVAPLMSDAYVKRERKAVDSEFQSKRREDGWRGMDAFKQAVNPAHPYSRFTVGNFATLPADTVRPALLSFYDKHYSADRMSAVIIGKENTETLLNWGKTLFSDVPKRNDPVDLTIDEQLFANKKLPLIIKNHSIKNEKNLSLYFQFPYQADNNYSKSTGYLSHILGYEGRGSLLESLKNMGYASGLYSDSGHRIGNEISTEISVELTDKGYQNTDKVLAVIFTYIDLLRTDSEGERRYTEIEKISKTAFEFREKGNAMNEVSGLATRMNRYAVKDILAINAIFSGYDKKEIDDYLEKMKPEFAIVQLTAPDIESTQKTHYFKVPYKIEVLDAKTISTLADNDKKSTAAMSLPNPNPFIADSYDLQKDEVEERHEVLSNGIELYYRNDTSFNVPRSSVQISLQPSADLSITDKTAMSLLAELLEEQLMTTLYDASIAGVDAGIMAGERSLIISLDGYQQKMSDLLTVILSQLKTSKVDKPTFTRIKNSYKEDLQNFSTKMPYQQTFAYLNEGITVDTSMPSERLAVIDSIDEETINLLAKKVLASLAVRMMVYGNHNYDEAIGLTETLHSHLETTKFKNKWEPNAAKSLTENLVKSFETEHEDSAITYYIQSGIGNKARAEIGLLAKMMEPEFFSDLRTEKQLGYVVFAYPRPSYSQSAIAFTVQSPVANADELEKHIVEFNGKFAKSLNELSSEEFSKIKAVLHSELSQVPENLMSAAGIYWSDILTTNKTISSRTAVAQEIDNIALDEFVKKMQRVLTDGKHIVIKAVPKK